jgi:hypothetical protein
VVYDPRACVLLRNHLTARPLISVLQDRAKTLGLTGIQWGIDEGRLLFGPTWEGDGNVPIGTRAVGNSYQASFDALFFKLMAVRNISWYSRWGVNTDGGNGIFTWPSTSAVDNIATNLARLTHRMVGEVLLDVINSTPPPTPNAVGGVSLSTPSIVDAVITAMGDGVGPSRGFRALVFHHYPELNGTTSAAADVSVCGFAAAASDAPLSGTIWTIGDECGNFWPQWWADRARLNLTLYNSGWSQYGESISWESGAQAVVWQQTLAPSYQTLANISSCAVPWVGTVNASGCAIEAFVLPPHTVLLWEASLTAPSEL